MSTLFISDLHLSAERPAINALFLEFLKTRAARSEALYILGDLFEYWIGDEAVAQAEYAAIVAGLAALKQNGVAVYLMHGNRDFLLGEEFCRATGARLLNDPTVIDLYGTPTLLMHGDLLCTDDVEYQHVRKTLRAPAFIADFLAKPVAVREQVVRGYREQSKAVTAQKAADIMDVNEQTVRETLQRHGVRNMIHGHTHRPADHRFDLGGAPARRIVLGDWYEQGSVLVCEPGRWRLEALALSRA